MINFNESYNEAVKNVSVASKFNFSFSEDMDYKMRGFAPQGLKNHIYQEIR